MDFPGRRSPGRPRNQRSRKRLNDSTEHNTKPRTELLRFDAADAENANSFTDIIAEEGGSVQIHTEEPRRAGFTFEGWLPVTLMRDGGLVGAGETLTVDRDVTYVAQWTQNAVPPTVPPTPPTDPDTESPLTPPTDGNGNGSSLARTSDRSLTPADVLLPHIRGGQIFNRGGIARRRLPHRDQTYSSPLGKQVDR